MIIFRGWGGLVVPLVSLFLAIVVDVAVEKSGNAQIAGVVGGIAGGILCWWWGSQLNDPAKDRIVIDPKTGKEIRLESRHKLMFIPVQYWAFGVFAVAAFTPATPT